MKIFGKPLEAYARPPGTTFRNGEVNIERLGKFIQIPESPNQISIKYITINEDNLRRMKYPDFVRLADSISHITGDEYRLPYFEEIYETYHYSRGHKEFKKSVESRSEYMAEIILDNKFLIRDPTDVRIEDGELKFDGERLPVKLAEESGYFYKTNEYCYPETVEKYPMGVAASWKPGLGKLPETRSYPVIRAMDEILGSGDTAFISAIARWDWDEESNNISARLVRVLE